MSRDGRYIKELNAKRTQAERIEAARRAGKASGVARTARKTMKDELLQLLSGGKTQERISAALIARAEIGDTKAYEIIRDTIGEKPVERQEITLPALDIKISDATRD